MAGLRPEEEWARQMIEAALGAPTVQHDDGTEHAMYDLRVHLPDGVHAAVEVTAAADPDSIELWTIMNGRDDRWVENGLKGGWMVSLHPRARARRLRRELPALLGHLEAAGITCMRHPRRSRGGFDAAVEDLGITSLFQSDGTDFPGSIYITIEEDFDRRAGWSNSDSSTPAEWIGEFLRSDRRADVRSKLARSGAQQRHAFVLAPGFSTAPFDVTNLLLGYGGTPTGSPDLPNEVTHVWMVSTWRAGTGWRWSPDDGWSPFDKLQSNDL